MPSLLGARPHRHQIRAVGIWLGVALGLGWLSLACLFGRVEHKLTPRVLRSNGAEVYAVLPGPFFHRGEPHRLRLQVLEDGLPLDSKHVRLAPRQGGLELMADLVLYFRTPDGSDPRRNGREYVARYPRRQRPAAILLLLTAWILLPWAARHLSRNFREAVPIGPSSERIAAWSVVGAVTIFSLFAVQAWLPPPSTVWLLCVAATGVGLTCARLEAKLLGEQGLHLPAWSLWVGGLLAWTLCTALGGSPHGSLLTVAGLIVMVAWGLLLYIGFHGSLADCATREPLVLGTLVVGTGLSLARDAGFDLAGGLASLGLSFDWPNGVANPWTTKFVGHWLLALTWCTLVVLWSRPQARRKSLALVLSLGVTGLVLNGSKSALIALVVSAGVAGSALRWPVIVRRVVIFGLVACVLLAPLLAGIPWQLHSHLKNHEKARSLAVLELDIRGSIWELSRRLVTEHLIVGWGLGASQVLPVGDLTTQEALSLAPGDARPEVLRRQALPGDHPHNAALLTWLELGLVGALFLAGLILAVGRSIASMEANRRVHASLLGLLTVHGVYLSFNYPLWEPEVLSLLWMSIALACVALPPSRVEARRLTRDAIAVLALLLIGAGALAQERVSGWWMSRSLRLNPIEMDTAGDRLLAGGEIWPVKSNHRLEAAVEWVEPGWIRGWAFDPSTGTAPEAVLVFLGSELVGIARPELESIEAFRQMENHDAAALTAGFLVAPPVKSLDFDAPVMVVALVNGEVRIVELPTLTDSPGNPRR